MVFMRKRAKTGGKKKHRERVQFTRHHDPGLGWLDSRVSVSSSLRSLQLGSSICAVQTFPMHDKFKREVIFHADKLYA
jgi:hypothetical protein